MGICCNTGKEDRMCCLPLAIGAMIWAVILIVLTGCGLGTTKGDVSALVNGIVSIVIWSLVFIGIILGTYVKIFLAGSIMLKIGGVYCIVDAIWKLIVIIMVWVFFSRIDNEAKVAVLVFSIVTTVIVSAIIIMELSIANGFISLACVYDAGGRGLEYKNYLEVKRDKQAEAGSSAAAPSEQQQQQQQPVTEGEGEAPPAGAEEP